MFNFSTLKASDAAVKEIVRALGMSGAVVIATTVDQTASKKAGVPFKAIHLSFADSQQIDLLIKETGDIFAVKLNGKDAPIRYQDDTKAAAKELAARLDAGRAKFQRAAAAVKVVVPPSIRTSRANLVVALTAKRDDLRVRVDGAKAQLAELDT